MEIAIKKKYIIKTVTFFLCDETCDGFNFPNIKKNQCGIFNTQLENIKDRCLDCQKYELEVIKKLINNIVTEEETDKMLEEMIEERYFGCLILP